MKLPRRMGFQRGLAPFGGVQRRSLWQDSKGQRPLGGFGRQPNREWKKNGVLNMAQKQTPQEAAENAGRVHTREHQPLHAPFPGLGLRSIKTALAASLTALLYAFFPDRSPTFACIGAIFGLGADKEESRRSGGNRFFGTIIGGFIGLGMYALEHWIASEGNYWVRLPLLFVGVIVLVVVCMLLRWPGGVQPGGVVLCIILYSTPPHHVDYAIDRMIDTGIGVLIALALNELLSRSRVERWLHLDKDKEKQKEEAGV